MRPSYKYIGLVVVTILILSYVYLNFNNYMTGRENIPTYIISKDEKGTITAKNESTGAIEFSGTDISDILTSVNNAITKEGIIKIKEGTYKPSSTVTFTKYIKLNAEGNVIFDWNNTTGQFLFIFIGSELSAASLTADVKANANIITVNDASSASNGDLVLIYDNTIWNPTYYPTWKTGELHEISSISGNNITIADTTINSFSTAQSGSVKIIRPITVEINGITIKGPGSTYLCRGIWLHYNKNSVIRNGKFNKCGRDEIVIGDSYQVTVENNNIGDNIYTGLGYGIVVADSSAYTNIKNNYFYHCRHCITVGGAGVVGQGRDTTVSFNTFFDSNGTQAVIDAHPIAESYYIYNNTIYSPPLMGAIVSGARVTKIIGNTIIGGLGIYPYTTTKSPGSIIEISDNLLIDSRRVFNNENNMSIYQINIENNIMTGDAIWSITILSNAAKYIISGNKFSSTNKGTGQWGIYVGNSNNGTISNNTINNSYYSGIKLDSVNNTDILNNIITDYNNYGDSGEKGIGLINSSYNTIANNILKRSGDTATYGIAETGTSDYNRIVNNNLNQVGTIISNRIQLVGSNTNLSNNQGYKTENNSN
jgi:parallel beta-helix repeat protein